MFSRSIRVFLTPSPRLSICFSCSTISDSPPRGEGKRPRVGERDEKSKKRRETGLAAHFSSLKLNVDAGVREDVCAVDAADEAWAWPLLRSNGQCLAVLAPPVNMSGTLEAFMVDIGQQMQTALQTMRFRPVPAGRLQRMAVTDDTDMMQPKLLRQKEEARMYVGDEKDLPVQPSETTVETTINHGYRMNLLLYCRAIRESR